ncbi:MAG: hypothetical protein ACRDJN_10480, partial [Chloroflexota bacterium]
MTVTTKLMALVAKLKFVVMVAVAAVAATLAALGGPAPPAHAQLFDLSGIYTRSVPTIAVDDEGTFNEANASCELGDTAVGGGYHFEEDLFSTHAYVSQPSTREDGTRPGHQWTIRMWSGGGGTGATVWVVCATGEAFGHGGGLRLARADSSVGPGSTGSVVATCPAGYKVLGGGYALDSSSFQFQNYAWVYGSYPSTPTQWRVDVNTVGEEAEPPVSITVSVEAWAICYPEIAPITLRTDSFAIPFPPFGAHEGAATCAGDNEMLGGGFRSSSKYLTVLRSSPPSADAWAVRVMPNLPAAPIDVTVYVFCHPNRPVVREAVELYAHGSLGGEVRRFDVAQSGQVMEVPDLSAFDFDDRTRSIRIYGPVFVSLYEHGNYGGRCETLRATDGQLLDNFIGAVAISSLRINVPCGTVELWDAPDFAGEVRRFTLDRSDQMVEEPILHLLGFNDRASSIRLIGSAFVSVYGNNHYGGRCETLRASDGRLADNFIGNDSISSFRINATCPVGTGEAAPTDQTVPRDAPVGFTLHYEVPETMTFGDLAWVE